MRILVTNDDGIRSPGVQGLARKMLELGDVVLAAPSEEKSAIGHGITIRDPIRVRKIKVDGVEQAWGVSGTPADCVKLGLSELLNHKCDLVISGINCGPNMGTDILYSGTVSAAIEGVILGIPSLAVSLSSWDSEDYRDSIEIVYRLVKYILDKKLTLPSGTLLNVNIPAVKKEEILGYKVTVLGERQYENRFEKRLDPHGNPYYWSVGKLLPFKEETLDYDVVAVEKKYVSITPIQFDLTNYKIIQKVKEWGLENL